MNATENVYESRKNKALSQVAVLYYLVYVRTISSLATD